ncbi:MAG: tRNA uridine-5-carboxymethylaminomethyl(34) synthesis GTPase MnmE [Candidatus Omnitrophota bacterium]|jgi:tRNA modification GTPase
MMNNKKDTIAAISTPPGEGGIGIVRLSGKDSLAIADRIFSSPGEKKLASCPSHSVRYGYIRVPGKREIVDEVLVTVMRAPRTYTMEDVVEISCHGGGMPLRKVLDLCLNAGARMAEPGEFTRRAFLNGRMDLSQAEAVLDIIKARSDLSRKAAARQLKGELSGRVGRLRGSLIDVLADIELAIDFTEEDVAFAPFEKISRSMHEAADSIKKILENVDKGIILREGINAVICGKPNVGKSSLMNALLRRDRVIVTPVAGTTRDVIEESINISGVTIRLCDTAGIIETRDAVEIEGVKRSREKMDSADIVIFVLDVGRSLSGQDEEIYEAVKGKNVIVVANKIDLPRAFSAGEAKAKFGAANILEASALEKIGLEKLEEAIAERIFKGKSGIPEDIAVTNARHKQALEKALEAIERGKRLTGKDYNGELLASDLNEAVYFLGLVMGESIDDDVLDRIFSRFCIGK